MQSTMPWTRRAGVVRLLAWAKRPELASNAMRSVKVPPISIAAMILEGDFARLGTLCRAEFAAALFVSRFSRYDTTMRNAAAKSRCPWCLASPLYIRYHDEEWGVPVHDDRRLFEFLILEGAQAGLSWSTILNKRDNYRRAFAGFAPARLARFGARDVKRLMGNAGIVRNRLKIESAIGNARAFLEVQREFGSFDAYLWNFVGGRPLQNSRRGLKQIPAHTPLSDV